MKYQRILGFIICICSIVFVLCGCKTAEDYEAFEELTAQCVEEDQSVMLELYDICQDQSLTLVYSHTDKISQQQADILPDEPSRGSEIADYLMSKYPITDIYYYDNLEMMELWFDENFYGMNWAIIYYPPGIEPPEDVPGYDHTEEIKDGFYRYYCYPGF